MTTLLLPFVLASLVAAGTMPERGAGGVEIVICSGSELVAITVPADQAPPGAPLHPSKTCPWDLASHPIVPAIVAEMDHASSKEMWSTAWMTPAKVSDRRTLLRRVSNRGPPLIR